MRVKLNNGKRKEAQSTLEYVMLIIVVMAVIISIQVYFKRAVQGRWRAATDDLGDQFDTRVVNTSITERISSVATTTVTTNLVGGRLWTTRRDQMDSNEAKTGFLFVPGVP